MRRFTPASGPASGYARGPDGLRGQRGPGAFSGPTRAEAAIKPRIVARNAGKRLSGPNRANSQWSHSPTACPRKKETQAATTSRAIPDRPPLGAVPTARVPPPRHKLRVPQRFARADGEPIVDEILGDNVEG